MKLLLDGLAHGVEAERRERAVGPLGAEQLQRLGLGRGGEGEVADVRQPAALLHLRDDPVFQVVARLARPPRSASSRGRSIGQHGSSGSCVLSPDCDEWASSMMTAKRLPGSSRIWSAITGNFCSVVTMIVLPSSSACFSCRRGRCRCSPPRRASARTGAPCAAAAGRARGGR